MAGHVRGYLFVNTGQVGKLFQVAIVTLIAVDRKKLVAITASNPGGNKGDDRPAAYLNYILFDKEYNVLNMGWLPAPESTFKKQKIQFNTLEIEEPGYVYVYLSYEGESNAWVYFDDLKVSRQAASVVQYNEYYPFGLQASTSWTRENEKNSYLYNGKSKLNSAVGWYAPPFRSYDPELGRFMQVDPMSSVIPQYSPYVYANCNPVLFNDPTGLLTRAEFFDILGDLTSSRYGGSWSEDAGTNFFASSLDAFYAGVSIMDANAQWGGNNGGFAPNFGAAARAYAAEYGGAVPLREVAITGNRNGEYSGEPYANHNWLVDRIDAALAQQRGLNAEAFIDKLLKMPTGDKITGKEISKLNDELGPVSSVVKNVTRVKGGLQVNLTLLAKGALAILPRAPEVRDGAIVTITREAWPDHKNFVLHVVSPDIRIYYDDKLVPLNIYINNNGFTMDKVPYPSYYGILKGKW